MEEYNTLELNSPTLANNGAHITPEGNMAISAETITDGITEKNSLKTKCDIAMQKMPDNINGIVIASGMATEKWKSRGWRTLDIINDFDPDIVCDVRNMDQHIQPNTEDFIFVEGLPWGKNGVDPEILFEQVVRVLKPGGKLIIENSMDEPGYNNLPSESEIANLLRENKLSFEYLKSAPVRVLNQDNQVTEVYRSVNIFAEKPK